MDVDDLAAANPHRQHALWPGQTGNLDLRERLTPRGQNTERTTRVRARRDVGERDVTKTPKPKRFLPDRSRSFRYLLEANDVRLLSQHAFGLLGEPLQTPGHIPADEDHCGECSPEAR